MRHVTIYGAVENEIYFLHLRNYNKESIFIIQSPDFVTKTDHCAESVALQHIRYAALSIKSLVYSFVSIQNLK